MAQQFTEISEKQTEFIRRQKIFFVGTATADSRVNISPKGMDTLKVLHQNRIVWLNATGSGNETSAHIQEDPRITIMFASFEGDPVILRLYGKARVIHKKDAEWTDLILLFNPIPASRQIFDVDIDLVQTSCGMAVPFFDYVAERDQLNSLHSKLGDARIQKYWEEKNQFSLDGKPTNIVKKSI